MQLSPWYPGVGNHSGIPFPLELLTGAKMFHSQLPVHCQMSSLACMAWEGSRGTFLADSQVPGKHHSSGWDPWGKIWFSEQTKHCWAVFALNIQRKEGNVSPAETALLVEICQVCSPLRSELEWFSLGYQPNRKCIHVCFFFFSFFYFWCWDSSSPAWREDTPKFSYSSGGRCKEY